MELIIASSLCVSWRFPAGVILMTFSEMKINNLANKFHLNSDSIFFSIDLFML